PDTYPLSLHDALPICVRAPLVPRPGSALYGDALHHHAARAGDDAAGLSAVPLAGVDRDVPTALGAGVLRQRLLHLLAAPVLSDKDRKSTRLNSSHVAI